MRSLTRCAALLGVASLIATGCGRDHHHHGGDGFTQPLTDPATQPLASGLGSPGSLAVDDEAVYYTDSPGGNLGKVPLAGGTVIILASGLENPTDIALDGTSVYCCASVISGSVLSVAKAGGAVATIGTATGVPRHVVADATSIYWADADDTGSVSSQISVLPKAGGAVAPLVSGVIAVSLATDGTFLYAYVVPPNAGFLTAPSSKITRIDPATGRGVDLATSLDNGASSLTVSGGVLYWIIFAPGMDSSQTGVAAMVDSGGAPTELVQRATYGSGGGAFLADGLGVDQGAVTFLANRFDGTTGLASGAIDRVATGGVGPISALTGFNGTGASLVTDATCLYFAIDDTIYVHPK